MSSGAAIFLLRLVGQQCPTLLHPAHTCSRLIAGLSAGHLGAEQKGVFRPVAAQIQGGAAHPAGISGGISDRDLPRDRARLPENDGHLTAAEGAGHRGPVQKAGSLWQPTPRQLAPDTHRSLVVVDGGLSEIARACLNDPWRLAACNARSYALGNSAPPIRMRSFPLKPAYSVLFETDDLMRR